ncbi:nitroreductase family protein [Mycolicibacterium sp. CBM1]
MPDRPVDRLAKTRVPVHPPIAARWSPRAFAPGALVTAEQLIALLEAARWAPTWGNRQPVRFVVGRNGDLAFTALAGLLRRGNSYAQSAGALILVCADEGEDERSALYATFDAGAAVANLSIEAVSRGLIVHPMAGFDVDGAQSAFSLGAAVRPLAMVAVGSLGDYAAVAPEIVERDARPRRRLPLEEMVLNWSGAGLAQIGELGDDAVVEQ